MGAAAVDGEQAASGRSLGGKVAIVTGAGQGIGREAALKLAAHGARVVVNDLDADLVADVVERIVGDGGRAVACSGSVTDGDFAERAVRGAVDDLGGLDVIVNNAGYYWGGALPELTDEQWDAMYDVHVKAPFRLLRAAHPVIARLVAAEAAEGRVVHRKVVNVSSGSARGTRGQANYSAAKAGVLGLTKAVAREWGELHVNVNAVAFGWIDTRLMAARVPGETRRVDGHDVAMGAHPDRLAALAKSTPLGRAGTAVEAAGAIYLLCAPESDYIHGQVLEVNGGSVM